MSATITHIVQVRRVGVPYDRWFVAECECGAKAPYHYRSRQAASAWADRHSGRAKP